MSTDTQTSTNQYKNKELIELWSSKNIPNQNEIDKIYELMNNTIDFINKFIKK